jgi:Domain of unknown function (DUF5916)
MTLAGVLTNLVTLLAVGAPTQFPSTVVATRRDAALVVDGKLDDPAWRAGSPYEAFIQVFPHQGARPSERTVVRVLYDEAKLYVGFFCFDSDPRAQSRRLGARDAPPPSDSVSVSIDAGHDHRTALTFAVNAAGVLSDSLHFDDTEETTAWDAVWTAEVARHPDGWSAELAIPLSLFRGAGPAPATWGFLARRHLYRAHEDVASAPLDRAAKATVSQFGHLIGVRHEARRPSVELLPYLAARLTRRPQFSDPARPTPRLTDPTLDLGLDLRAALTPRLVVNAAINPDFGQVEADRLILNLSNQEVFFPEKRPFFFQGTEVFEPVGAGSDGADQQRLFYSRRIGLDTPILGAVKLTGVLGDFELGLLDVVVAGPSGIAEDEANPDRRFRFHPARPLHFGPNDEVARTPGLPRNFFAGVIHRQIGSSRVGARVSSGLPLGARCTPEDEKRDPLPESCTVVAGHAAALDWDLRTRDGAWVFMGQAEGSLTAAGPSSRALRDGTVLPRGARGYGGYFRAGKVGGEPLRFTLDGLFASPTLELNPVGFLPTQNLALLEPALTFVRPTGFQNGFAGLYTFEASLGAEVQISTDGRGVNRGRSIQLEMEATLPGFHVVGAEIGTNAAHYDVREIESTGIAFERPATSYVALWGSSNQNRSLTAEGVLAFGWHPATPASPAGWGWTAELETTFHPSSRFESRLSVLFDRTLHGPRYTDQPAGDAGYLFGDLNSETLSLLFRQQVVFLPRLVLQAYVQLFSAYGAYEAFFTGTPAADRTLRIASLVPTAQSAPDFHETGLNVNLVLRWEFRPGSNLYLVYTHAREGAPVPDGAPAPRTLRPARLGRGPAVDGFLLKWSYWWDL